MRKYETIIGLEVHVELATKSKIFCSCSTGFGAPPNTHTCPICLGHPGVLPVLNKEAVNFAIKASLALNCDIATHSKFDRKNYFYPDSPKAYQISQYDRPIGENGSIEIEVGGEKKRIGITRVHLEEDAGKLNHIEEGNYSLVDFNRVGVPLIEIVSEPDMRSPKEAKAYLEKLKLILQYLGVSDVKMEEGSLRCDANISLRPFNQEAFGAKNEMKNLNSFRNVEKSLEYEEKRQSELLDKGELITQQTSRWLENEGRTKLMRTKEDAHDYRYFSEPDLVKLHIDDAWKDNIRSLIPELPDAKKHRYVDQYNLSDYDASILTSSKEVSDYYDRVVNENVDAKVASNWVTTDLLGYLNKHGIEINEIKSDPKSLAELIFLIEKGSISTKIARSVFKDMVETGKDPKQIIEEKGLIQISDVNALSEEVKRVIDANPQSVDDFKNGKDRAVGFLVGQVMKATNGQANPQVVNELIRKKMSGL